MLDTQGAAVKLRRPWVVGALTVVPFYEWYWYYRINCEMRDYGRARGNVALATSRPVHSIVAVTLGSLVMVPVLLSLLGAVGRVQACERLTNSNAAGASVLVVLLVGSIALAGASGVIGHGVASTVTLALAIGASAVFNLLIQRRLNAVWSGSGSALSRHVVDERPKVLL